VGHGTMERKDIPSLQSQKIWRLRYYPTQLDEIDEILQMDQTKRGSDCLGCQVEIASTSRGKTAFASCSRCSCQFSLGVGTLSATLNADPIPDGRFLRWLGQVQRVQLLDGDNLLLFGVDVQASFDPLLASQQFVIGGAQSIRGYRQNIRHGDNGFRTLWRHACP
jgi:hypothetical protein